MKIRALAILNIFLILLASGCTTANKPATLAEARIVTRITPPSVVVFSPPPHCPNGQPPIEISNGICQEPVEYN